MFRSAKINLGKFTEIIAAELSQVVSDDENFQ